MMSIEINWWLIRFHLIFQSMVWWCLDNYPPASRLPGFMQGSRGSGSGCQVSAASLNYK